MSGCQGFRVPGEVGRGGECGNSYSVWGNVACGSIENYGVVWTCLMCGRKGGCRRGCVEQGMNVRDRGVAHEQQSA